MTGMFDASNSSRDLVFVYTVNSRSQRNCRYDTAHGFPVRGSIQSCDAIRASSSCGGEDSAGLF